MSAGLCYTLSLLPEALKEKASTLYLSNDKTKSNEGSGFGFRIHGLSHPYTYDQRFETSKEHPPTITQALCPASPQSPNPQPPDLNRSGNLIEPL